MSDPKTQGNSKVFASMAALWQFHPTPSLYAEETGHRKCVKTKVGGKKRGEGRRR
jgi:hypothetical protein